MDNVSVIEKKESPERGTTRSKADVKDFKSERHSMRMYPEDFQMLVYWADQYGMDRTEFLITSMQHYIKWRNQDYDLPTAEVQRLNQLVDAIQNMTASQKSLENSTISGFNAMLGVIRGGNYLVDDEDGEL